MTVTTREERQWLLRNIADGLNAYLNSTAAPVMVEDLLRHPPEHFAEDFGIVNIFSSLWDATFVRPMNRMGSVFVRVDLPPDARNYALARETLLALVSGKHARKLGLHDVLIPYINEAADYFALELLAPEILVQAYFSGSGTIEGFAEKFIIPAPAAEARWRECIG